MIDRIISFSLTHRLLTVVGWLLVFSIGVGAAGKLPLDAVPDVTNVQVQVLSEAPGLAPEEVESFVTFPVEAAMSGLPAVEEIRSVSKFGLSVVTVVFEEHADIYWARQLVSERLAQARAEIPEGYGEPELGPISTGLGEIFQFELKSDRPCEPGGEDTKECHSLMELRTLLDWTVSFQLRTVPGIVEVNSFGGELKSYQLTLKHDRLIAYGLTVKDVLEALRENHRNVGGGYIAHQGEQVLIRGEGLIEDLRALGRVVVSRDEHGTPILASDVADAEFAPVIRQGAVTRDGQGEAVIGIVMMLMGENSRRVVADVKDKVSEIEKSLPQGVTIEPFYDRTELVDRTVRTVTTNLLEGGALVVLVLLLLLGNLRAGLIVATTIPLAFAVAVLAMLGFGLSANLMSLGAMDFGIIVDGAVVMADSILVGLSGRLFSDQRERREVLRASACEVGRPVVFSVFVITIVYLPVLGLRGVEGKMFIPMALSVLIALLGSLAVALTWIPVLCELLLGRVSESRTPLYRWVRALYVPLLERAIQFKYWTVGVAVLAFFSSLLLIPRMGAEFIPTLDEGAIAMQVWRLPSVNLDQSNRISTIVEKVLKDEFPEISTVVSRTGRAEIATDPMGVEISDTYLMLQPRDTWRFDSKESLVEAIDETLERNVAGAIFSYSQPIQLRVQELISGSRAGVAIRIYGDDLSVLQRSAANVEQIVRGIVGAADVKAEQITGLPVLRVSVNRDAIARLGISVDDVLRTVEAVGGTRVGTVIEGQKRFALQVRFGSEVTGRPEQVGRLRVGAHPLGERALGPPLQVPLSQVADISIEEGPAQISRERISRRITVEVNVRGRDLASFVSEAKEQLDERLSLPPGYQLEFGGQYRNLKEASLRLAFLIPIAMILIFILLQTALGSTKSAALVFLNVPISVTGGLVALVARGYPLSISAGIGFIALFGVAVMNGVVLVSFLGQRLEAGLSPEEASKQAGVARLRAVLMTALTDIIGFAPMALSTTAGAEVQRPLATVVMGGLCTSTLLTLLVLPALFAGASPGRLADGSRSRSA